MHDIEAGILQETEAKMYVFTYHEDYSGEPVCLAMPVRREPYLSNYLFPYFFNMLSEGANREPVDDSSYRHTRRFRNHAPDRAIRHHRSRHRQAVLSHTRATAHEERTNCNS